VSRAKSFQRNGKAELAAAVAMLETHKAAVFADMAVSASKAKSYERLGRDQIVGNRFVKVYGFGWRPVVTVNVKTVTVLEPTAWDGKARYTFDKIVEVRP
jgi:hypothetical protein